MLRARTIGGLAAAFALLLAGSAAAEPTTQISGNPMTVWVGDQGQLQAQRAGDTSYIFFAPSNPVGDAGFFLAFPQDAAGVPVDLAGKVYGFNGSAGPFGLEAFVARSQSPVTGAGVAGSPFTQVTTYAVNPTDATDTTKDLALVTQTTTYVNGEQTFHVKWDVKNVSSPAVALPFKALLGADFYFEGDDRGTGIFTQGPPRFVGGTNADTGRSGGFVESPAPATPWSHYEALTYSTEPLSVWTRIGQAGNEANTKVFNDTAYAEPDDNAGGVEWDDHLTTPLAGDQTASYEVTVRTALPAALQFDQTNAGAPQGTPITFTVTAKDTADVPFAGKTLRWEITGANAMAGGNAVLDGTGVGRITDPGTNAGFDTIAAYVDLNNNNARDANEPQASALATFVDNVPPKCGVQVSGSRPGGTGGAGKPLVITVNCDSPATVTTTSTFTITPPKAKTKKAKAKKSSAQAAAKKKSTKKSKKKAKKKKAKKRKKIVVKLPAATAQVAPGQAVPVNITVPKSVAKKYAGAKVTATVVVTAVDQAGNTAQSTATKTVTLAKPKPKKKPKKKSKKKTTKKHAKR